ncbi:hypothetical protein AX16_010147 [Volvariella volvacea WC 439]|nr:hypothetical protein AX16_010147 [Volvariella volvacea WC 439]
MALICNWIAMIAVLYIARKGWFFPLPELQCSELWTPVGFIQTAVNTPVGFWMLPAPPGVETTLTAQKSIPIYAVGCAIVAIVYYPILYIGMRRERRGCVENVA